MTPSTPRPVLPLAPGRSGPKPYAYAKPLIDRPASARSGRPHTAHHLAEAPWGTTDRGEQGPERHRTTGVRLQPRDMHLLQFLARYRYATYQQLAVRLDTTVGSLRHRLPKLKAQGLINTTQAGASKFLLWRVTDDGAAVAGLNLPAPHRIAWSTIGHTLGLVDLGTIFEADGEVVLTEAEIRAADMRNAVSDRMAIVRGQGHRILTNQPMFAIGARAGGSKNHLHVPDLVLARDIDPAYPGQPQSIAVEIELSRKTPSRVRSTLLAYSKAPNIGLVYYYTHDAQIRDLINRAAIDTGTTGIVVIRRWEPSVAMGLIET